MSKIPCEFCKKDFKTISSLNYHQKTAKFCLNLRNQTNNNFNCELCLKTFTTKDKCKNHYIKCKNIFKNFDEYKNETIILKDKIIDKDKLIEDLRNQIQVLQDKLENIAIQSNIDKDIKIQHLTKKYVKKIPRFHYEEKNVIYIITTERLKKDNIYILGKATNLTSRLSTYNKTDEHEVIYYQECPGDSMSIVENMVFNKLEEYRQSANRERFILPDNLKINIFIEIIKNSINFFSK
jgi:hypothetical protein